MNQFEQSYRFNTKIIALSLVSDATVFAVHSEQEEESGLIVKVCYHHSSHSCKVALNLLMQEA